jgi:hypothetical protein
VLISETLGSLGFNEGFLSTVEDARKRLLTTDARIIPSNIALWSAPIEIPALYAERIDWWTTTRYGYDFSPLRVFVANTLHSTKLPRETLLADPRTVIDIDASNFIGTSHCGRATFTATRNGIIHAFALGFTAQLAPGITVSNAWEGADSWERGILPLESPIRIDEGASIDIEIQTDNGRSWTWESERFRQTTMLSRPPCIRNTP